MKKNQLVTLWMTLGFFVAVIVFVLGVDFFPFFMNSTTVVIALFMLFLIGLIIYTSTNDDALTILINKSNSSLVSSIYDLLPSLDKTKEKTVQNIATLINSYVTRAFILGTLFSTAMILLSLLSYSGVLKQNKIIEKQNYLICQQNKFLEGANKFGSNANIIDKKS